MPKKGTERKASATSVPQVPLTPQTNRRVLNELAANRLLTPRDLERIEEDVVRRHKSFEKTDIDNIRKAVVFHCENHVIPLECCRWMAGKDGKGKISCSRGGFPGEKGTDPRVDKWYAMQEKSANPAPGFPRPVPSISATIAPKQKKSANKTTRNAKTSLSDNVSNVVEPTISQPIVAGSKRSREAYEESSKAGKKQSAQEKFQEHIQIVRATEEWNDDDVQYTESCNVIRNKLRAMFDSGEVKVTHWLKEHSVNTNSYGRFMKLSGPTNGSSNSTYFAACRYFAGCKAAGITPLGAPGGNKKQKANGPKSPLYDVSSIHLDGEEENEVPVFDDCDEIRHKISTYLRSTVITQAEFLRQLAKQYHPERKIQSTQLNEFRRKSGEDAGNTSAVFYASYVYFEKLRLKEGKPKSEHRLDMEDEWEPEGFDTKHINRPQKVIAPHWFWAQYA